MNVGFKLDTYRIRTLYGELFSWIYKSGDDRLSRTLQGRELHISSKENYSIGKWIWVYGELFSW